MEGRDLSLQTTFLRYDTLLLILSYSVKVSTFESSIFRRYFFGSVKISKTNFDHTIPLFWFCFTALKFQQSINSSILPESPLVSFIELISAIALSTASEAVFRISLNLKKSPEIVATRKPKFFSSYLPSPSVIFVNDFILEISNPRYSFLIKRW